MTTAKRHTYTLAWRELGAKRRGNGFSIESGRRSPEPWAIDVGFIAWPTETFFRVGLIVHRRGHMTEVAHLRFPTEADAFDAVTWLAAVADDEAPKTQRAYVDSLFAELTGVAR